MNNDHVLIVVSINNTTGDTTFLRSYISRDTFDKIEESGGKFKGFNIPSSAVYKNIEDNCQKDGLRKGCITIAIEDDEFPKLGDYQTDKYGFIVTSTASPGTIEMYITGEKRITYNEKEIRTIADIVPYERAKITTASDGAVDGVLGFFEPSAPSSAPSSASSSASPSASPSASSSVLPSATVIKPTTGNPNNDNEGFIRVTEYNGLYKIDETTRQGMPSIPNYTTTEEANYNNNSKIYKFVKYNTTALTDRDRQIEMYQVILPNPPTGLSNPLWIKGNTYDENGYKMLATVITPEEAAKENSAAAKVEPLVKPPIASDKLQTPSGASLTPSGASLTPSGALSVSQTPTETKTSTAANLIKFHEEIDRLLSKPDLSAAIKAVGGAAAAAASAIGKSPAVKEEIKPKPNSLSAAIKAVGDAAAAAATAIGKMKPKSTEGLAGELGEAVRDTLNTGLDVLVSALVSDDKLGLPVAISSVAEAATKAAIAVGKLSMPPAGNVPSPERSPAETEEQRVTEEQAKVAEEQAKVASDKVADEQRVTKEQAKDTADKLAEENAASYKLAERATEEQAAANESGNKANREAAKIARNKARKQLIPLSEDTLAPINTVVDKAAELYIKKDDVEATTGFNGEAIRILGIPLKGGSKIGNNRTNIDIANDYIDEFKTDTRELLDSDLFIKLTSLSTNQLSEIITGTAFQDKDDATVSDEDKAKMLFCIINFLYCDFTFYVLFNKNLQKLLFKENTFDEYIKLNPSIENQRNNYITLLTKTNVKSPSAIYDQDKFNKLIKRKNDMGGIEYQYIQPNSENNKDEDSYNNKIRAGELTLYINEFLGFLTGFQKTILHQISFGNDELERGTYDSYNILIQYIDGKYNQLVQLNTAILPIIKANTVVFKRDLETEISKNSTENIITYLKLRNDNDITKTLNDRFYIGQNKNTKYKSILVKYRNDNFPFYNEDETIYTLLKPKISGQNVYNGIGMSSNMLDIKQYTYIYQFGKFTDIFYPEKNNQTIASEMKTITDKIKGGKPVFMLGYGASGAGKTSSLIYYNDGKKGEDGILIHLCNLLSDKYDKLEVCSREFFHVNKKDGVALKELGDPTIVYAPSDKQKRIQFKLSQGTDGKGKFILETDYEHENYHQYRVLTPKKRAIGDLVESQYRNPTSGSWTTTHWPGKISAVNKNNTFDIDFHDAYNSTNVPDDRINPAGTKRIIATVSPEGYTSYSVSEPGKELKELILKEKPNNALIEKHIFKAGASLGAVAIHLIDRDRFVKATTNNPNSSRSHTLIFVKLINKDSDGSPGNIVIGDFAGVENAFACEDSSTIGKFLNIKRDPEKTESYYSTESYNGDPDPYGELSIVNDVPIISLDKYKAEKEAEDRRKFDAAEVAKKRKKGGGISNECKPLINITDPIYDFDNPTIRKSWDLKDGVKEFCGKNNSKFKAAISIIRQHMGVINLDKENYNESGIKNAYSDLKINDLIEKFGIYYEKDNVKKPLTEKKEAELKKKIELHRAEIARLPQDKTKPQGIIEKIIEFNRLYNQSTIANIEFANTGKTSSTHTISSISIGDNKQAEKFKIFFNSVLTNQISKPENMKIYSIEKGIVEKIIGEANKIIGNADNPRDKDGKSISNINEKFNKVNNDLKNSYDIKNAIISSLTAKITETIDILNTLNSAMELEIAKVEAVIQIKNKEIVDFEEQIKSNKSDNAKLISDIKTFLDNNHIHFSGDIYENIIKNEQFIKYIRDVEIEKACRESNSGVICENRREEGRFINDSLSKVRDVIGKILYEKNKDKINISPEFIDKCLSKYRLSDEGYFKFDKVEDKESQQTGSVIFNEIYEVLKKDNGNEKYQTVQELYKDIIVSVFCVFNISIKANNPPPVPYMDINDLKRVVFSGIPNEKAFTKFKQLGEKIITMISTTCNQQTLEAPEGFGDKVANLKTIEYPEKKYNKLDYDSKDKNTIYDDFVFIAKLTEYDEFKSNYDRAGMYEKRIRNFIDMIDNSNAVSAIGTLEFLDIIAKYNSVKTICDGSDSGVLNALVYTKLYATGGGTKGNTKRHKTKRKHKTTTLKSYSRR